MTRCHCGEPAFVNDAIAAGFSRGMCEHCDSVRCDLDPANCRELLHRHNEPQEPA